MKEASILSKLVYTLCIGEYLFSMCVLCVCVPFVMLKCILCQLHDVLWRAEVREEDHVSTGGRWRAWSSLVSHPSPQIRGRLIILL